MKTPVSTFERKLLLGFALTAFVLFCIFLAQDVAETERLIALQERSSFVIDAVRTRLAVFHLMTLVVFGALVFSRKYVLSTILTGSYGVLMIISYYFRLDGEGVLGGGGFYSARPLQEIIDKSHTFDLVAAAFVFATMFWQLTIMFRLYSKRSGRQSQ